MRGPYRGVSDGIGKRLFVLRLRRNLTLRKTGDRAGISAMMLCDIEHGRRKPTIKTLEKIAKALRVNAVLESEPCAECSAKGTVQRWTLSA